MGENKSPIPNLKSPIGLTKVEHFCYTREKKKNLARNRNCYMEHNLTQIIIILNSGCESGWVCFCKEKKTQKPKLVVKLDLGYESLAVGECVGP